MPRSLAQGRDGAFGVAEQKGDGGEEDQTVVVNQLKTSIQRSANKAYIAGAEANANPDARMANASEQRAERTRANAHIANSSR